MAVYQKRGTDLHRPASTTPADPLPLAPATPQALQAILAQWLTAAPCAQCGQAAVRLQGWRGSGMLVLVGWCAQHGPAE